MATTARRLPAPPDPFSGWDPAGRVVRTRRSGCTNPGWTRDPCHFVDVLPTLVDLAGGSVAVANGPPLAGRSLAPAFHRDGAAPHEFLYVNHNNNRALRVGDWKLIATGRIRINSIEASAHDAGTAYVAATAYQ